MKPSGIEHIAPLADGTHFCLLYDRSDALAELLAQYFKAGIAEGEDVLWLVSLPLDAEGAFAALQTVGTDSADMMAEGRLEIMDAARWRQQTTTSDVDPTRFLNDRLTRARIRGARGLRMSWDVDWPDALPPHTASDFAAAVRNLPDRRELLAMTTCAIGRLEPVSLMETICQHDFAVIQSAGKWRMLRCSAPAHAVTGSGSQDWFKSLAEAGLEGIVFSEDYRIVYCNPQFARLLGYSTAQLMGKRIESLAAEKDRGRIVDNIQRNREERLEYEMIHKDGDTVYVEGRGKTIRHNGRVLRATVVHDITNRKTDEAVLSRAKNDWERTFDTVPDMIMIIDNHFRIQRLNRTAAERLGRTPQACIGNICYEIFCGLSRPPAECPHAQTLADNREHVAEIHIDALKSDFIISTTPFKDERGQLIGCVHVSRDITQRKQAEHALQETQHRLRLAMQVGRSFAFEWDPATDRVMRSDESAPVLGLENEPITTDTGKNYFNRIHADDRERFVKTLRGLTPAADTYRIVYRLCRADGTEVTLEESGRGFFDDRDQMVRLVGMAANVTERETARQALQQAKADLEVRVRARTAELTAAIKKLEAEIAQRREAEAALRKSEARLAIAQQVAHLGSWELDMVKNALWWSDEVYRIFEVAPDRFDGTYEAFVSCVHPDDRASVDAAFTEAVENRAPYDVVHRLLMADGRVKWVNERCEIHYDDHGRPLYAAGTVLDITQQWRTEQELRQSQKMDAIGRLAGSIAHDFNNQLSVINGYAELAISQLEADTPLHKQIEEIRDAGERAADLTQQLLVFSRKENIEPQILDLNDVISGIQGMLGRLITENIELKLLLSPETVYIRADQGHMEQVIMNLSVNARDAMPEGGRLVIETRPVYFDAQYAQHYMEISEGSYVMLAVSDTGRGMSDEIKTRIFEPFFTTKASGKGTGLGLSTVYGIVKQSSGHIQVYTEPEKGTVFKIYFPQVTEETTMPKAEEYEPHLLRGDETVLVVEDEPAVRQLAGEIMASAGYNVLSAANSQEALSLCEHRSEPVDLLLTDVVMTMLSGPELAEMIREIFPGIKVLYMSGYLDHQLIGDGRMADRNFHFISKPLAAAELTRKVRQVLDGMPA